MSTKVIKGVKEFPGPSAQTGKKEQTLVRESPDKGRLHSSSGRKERGRGFEKRLQQLCSRKRKPKERPVIVEGQGGNAGTSR